MQIPDAALPYILFQRTAYLISSRIPLLRKLPYRLRVGVEAKARKRTIRQLFVEDMHNEYQSIVAYLPAHAHKILDIGCGIGGIDVLLFEHYRNKGETPQFVLLDKEKETPEIYYSFNAEGAAYNSLSLAKKLLAVNGVPDENIETVNIDAQSFPTGHYELIISLISWGWHYPIATYLDEVTRALQPGGRLIIDVRSETDGEQKLKACFSSVETIQKDKRGVRLVCTR